MMDWLSPILNFSIGGGQTVGDLLTLEFLATILGNVLAAIVILMIGYTLAGGVKRRIRGLGAHGLSRVEAGAQGEHKIARGYLPHAVHSLHWIADPGFRAAVEQFLEAERRAVDEEIEVLTTYGPFRKDKGEPE